MIPYYKSIITAAFSLLGVTACTSEGVLDNASPADGKPVEVTASIGCALETKATLCNGDNLSYESFVKEDAIGFFASGGLTANNEKLTYGSGSFLSKENSLQWKDGNATGVEAYYPYSTLAATVSIWREASSASGKIWKEGFEDFLISNKGSVTNGTLVDLSFKHHFAMLIIKRGTGFEEASLTDGNDKDVTVTLNKKVGKTACFASSTLTLNIDDTKGVNKLTANEGSYTPKGKASNVSCYYVLIPVGMFEGEAQGGCEVTSITLKNSAGVAVTIPYQKKLANNYKYLITARMRNDQAVIDLEKIVQWEKEEIPIVKPKGIDGANFDEWLAAYNTSKNSKVTIENQAALAAYGTLTGEKWTFLLLEDIDLKTISVNWGDNGKNGVVVSDFSDILDGQGHTITGIKLTPSTAGNNTGFFGTLSGTVKNLKLQEITVKGAENTGAIAGSMTAGSITNCAVEGFSPVLGTTNVGGLVGSYTGGAISTCTSSATVSGSSSVGLLVGNKREGASEPTQSISTGTLITITNP